MLLTGVINVPVLPAGNSRTRPAARHGDRFAGRLIAAPWEAHTLLHWRESEAWAEPSGTVQACSQRCLQATGHCRRSTWHSLRVEMSIPGIPYRDSCRCRYKQGTWHSRVDFMRIPYDDSCRFHMLTVWARRNGNQYTAAGCLVMLMLIPPRRVMSVSHEWQPHAVSLNAPPSLRPIPTTHAPIL